MSDLVENLQAFAERTSGYILVRLGSALVYAETDTVMTSLDPDVSGVDGCGVESPDAHLRMAKLLTLLEKQEEYCLDEHYCVVVTDWVERAEDIAQFVASSLNQPITPMLLRPEQADQFFNGPRSFSKAHLLEATGTMDGSHRRIGLNHGALYGLRDKKRGRA